MYTKCRNDTLNVSWGRNDTYYMRIFNCLLGIFIAHLLLQRVPLLDMLNEISIFSFLKYTIHLEGLPIVVGLMVMFRHPLRLSLSRSRHFCSVLRGCPYSIYSLLYPLISTILSCLYIYYTLS